MKSLAIFLFAAVMSAQTVKPAIPLICGDGHACRKDVEPERCVCLPKSATITVVRPALDVSDTNTTSYCDAPSRPCAFADAYVTASVLAASFECLTPDDNTLKDCKLHDGHTLTEALQVLYTAYKDEERRYLEEKANRDKDRISYAKFLDRLRQILKMEE